MPNNSSTQSDRKHNTSLRTKMYDHLLKTPFHHPAMLTSSFLTASRDQPNSFPSFAPSTVARSAPSSSVESIALSIASSLPKSTTKHFGFDTGQRMPCSA